LKYRASMASFNCQNNLPFGSTAGTFISWKICGRKNVVRT
jgi:hypothetical protein